MVSVAQTLIFSWVLLETYQSFPSFMSTTGNSSSTDPQSSSSSYSFSSPVCPIGFLPVTQKSSRVGMRKGGGRGRREEGRDDAHDRGGAGGVGVGTERNVSVTHTANISTVASGNVSAPSATSPMTLELRLADDDSVMASSVPPASPSPSQVSMAALIDEAAEVPSPSSPVLVSTPPPMSPSVSGTTDAGNTSLEEEPTGGNTTTTDNNVTRIVKESYGAWSFSRPSTRSWGSADCGCVVGTWVKFVPSTLPHGALPHHTLS
ncbi:hypothetical protein Pcinc_034074 [Petrolisthes cinctipes]|uniref:Uncharacterized protein n=1 Tax=Petrolisthes cinctipes TaxID=88211 RepID=A0AAE1JY13_PETCI|nr:hypothetical protein Pcinc_034074 [Petrolisthes cinctipes]